MCSCGSSIFCKSNTYTNINISECGMHTASLYFTHLLCWWWSFGGLQCWFSDLLKQFLSRLYHRRCHTSLLRDVQALKHIQVDIYIMWNAPSLSPKRLVQLPWLNSTSDRRPCAGGTRRWTLGISAWAVLGSPGGLWSTWVEPETHRCGETSTFSIMHKVIMKHLCNSHLYDRLWRNLMVD